MSGNEDDEEEEKDIGPSFEEQVKFLRKARKAGSTGFQMTTEFNVSRKLSKEQVTGGHGYDQASLDKRLENALNREAGKGFFEESLAGAVVGKKSSSNSNLRNLFAEDDLIVGKARRADPVQEQISPVADPVSSPQVVPDLREKTNSEIFPSSPSSDTTTSTDKPVSQQPVANPDILQAPANPEASQPVKGREYTIKLRRTPSSAPKVVAPAPSAPDEVVPTATSPDPEILPPSTEGELRECPRCAELIKKKAIYCRFCQLDLPSQSPGSAGFQPASTPITNQVPIEDSPSAVTEPGSVGVPPVPAPLLGETIPMADEFIPIQGTDLDARVESEPAGSRRSQAEAEVPEAAELVDSRVLQLQEEFEGISREFKGRTGFDMVLSGNEISLVLNASGQSLNMFSTDLSDAGLEDAQVFAGTLIEQYLEVLSNDFGIEFSKPNDVAVRQLEYNDDGQLVPMRPILARQARIDELKALHRAIEYSWPASYQEADQLPMRVVFLSDTLVRDEDVGVRVKILEDGRPVLFFSSTLCNQGRPTELDPIGGDNYESWQASIMRELAWKSAVDCNKFPLNPDEYEALGWVSVGDGFYALQTKADDFYLPYGGAEGPEQAWAKCNENGEPIGKNGEVISQPSELVFISNAELARAAKFTPCGDHFDTIEDYIVDALRCFRQGADWRTHLGRINPTLYGVVKALDQLNINRCYSPLRSYNGLIRSPKGGLVENTAEQQKEISLFEQKFLAKK